MTTVLSPARHADVPVPRVPPGPPGTHITIRGLTKYFAGWPLYENFDLDIPKRARSSRCSAPTAAARAR